MDFEKCIGCKTIFKPKHAEASYCDECWNKHLEEHYKPHWGEEMRCTHCEGYITGETLDRVYSMIERQMGNGYEGYCADYSCDKCYDYDYQIFTEFTTPLRDISESLFN